MQSINSRTGEKRMEIKACGMDGRKGGGEKMDSGTSKGQRIRTPNKQYSTGTHTSDGKPANVSPRTSKLQAASRNCHHHRVPHTCNTGNRERAQLQC